MSDKYDPQEMAGITKGIKPREDGESLDLGPCASGTRAKSWVSLEIRRGGERIAYQYVHLGISELAPDGISFTLTFNVYGEKWAVHVQGRNLVKLFTHLHHHKIEWISQADPHVAKFANDGELIITSISVVEVKPEPVNLSA